MSSIRGNFDNSVLKPDIKTTSRECGIKLNHIVAYVVYVGMLSANTVQMLSYFDIEDGKYLSNSEMPKIQISSLGICIGAAAEDVRHLNVNPWHVSNLTSYLLALSTFFPFYC